MADMDNLNAEDARECAAFLDDACAAILAALNRLPVPDDSPRFARFLAISALLRLAMELMESAVAEHPADLDRGLFLLDEIAKRLMVRAGARADPCGRPH